MKLNNWSLNLGYPVYGAAFVNDHTVIVAGGGGDGNNGIPNKMTAILIQPGNEKKPIKRYRELTLNDNEDSVMSLDVGNGTILTGINESSPMMAKGVNKHLRKFKFENEHLKFVESVQIHPNTNSTIYQKLTAVSQDGSVGVIVMSDIPSSIYIVESVGDLEEKFKIVTDGDVKDITISQDGKLMCYITSNVFEVISLITGRSVFKTKLQFLMSKVRFLNNNEVIISGSKNKDAFIAKFSISSSKVIQQKVIMKSMKGITSMDVNVNNNLTVLATSNYSLLLVRTSDFKVVKILNKVHEFAITKVVFSENGKYIASCSAANTVNIVEVPDNFAASKSLLSTIFQYIVSIIFVVLLGIGTQYLYEHGYINVAVNKTIELYEAYKPQDSSSYFTVEPIQSFDSSTTAESTTPHESLATSSALTSLERLTSSSCLANTATLSLDYTSSVTQLTSSVRLADLTVSNDIVSDFTTVTPLTAKSSQSFHNNVLNASLSASDIGITSNTVSSITVSHYGVVTEERVDNDRENIDSKSAVSSFEQQPLVYNSPNGIHTSDVASGRSYMTTTSERSLLAATNASVEPITKEVTKEITSVLIQTETSTATETAIFTSVEKITSVETSVETSFSITTSVVVQYVTKEVIVTTTDVSTTMKEPTLKGSSPSSEIATEESAVSDSNVGNTTTVTTTAPTSFESVTGTSRSITLSAQPVDLVEESEMVKAVVESSLHQVGSVKTTDVGIQVEPHIETFDDKDQASLREKEINYEELGSKLLGLTGARHKEDAVTTTFSTEPTVSLQIEPAKEIYDNPKEAILKEEERILEELLSEKKLPTSQVSIQIEPSSEVYTDPSSGVIAEASKITREILEKIANSTEAATVKEADSGDGILKAAGVEVTAVTDSDLVKDEL